MNRRMLKSTFISLTQLPDVRAGRKRPPWQERAWHKEPSPRGDSGTMAGGWGEVTGRIRSQEGARSGSAVNNESAEV